MKLFSNCSEWIGKLNNREYHDEYCEYIDKDGKKQEELEHQDYDVSIATDTFPNGGLSTAIDCIKKGFGIDDIEWENSGGGASGHMLEKDFSFARLIVDSKIEFGDEEIDILDKLIWDNTETEGIEKIFSNVRKGKIDGFALNLMKIDNAFGKALLKINTLKQKTRAEIEKIMVTNRLEGKE